MRILYLSRWYPFPPNNGSKLRNYNLLNGLQRKHDVTLLSFAEPSEQHSKAKTQSLESDHVHVITRRPFNPARMRARVGFLSSTPRSVVDTYSSELACRLQQLLASNQFDLVIASQFDMAVYSSHFRHLPALFEEVEVGTIYEKFLGTKPIWRRLRNGLTWWKHRNFLSSLLENFQLCTVASSIEKRILLAKVNPHRRIEVVPNSVDVQAYHTQQLVKRANTLIFTGAFSFEPNYAAMQWFVQKVLPLIKAQAPETELVITGDHANKILPTSGGITLAGYVEDVRSLVASATVSVAPIQSGGGTRLKILEAMALRTPIVATSKGAEGLDVVHGQHILIADTPQDFASATVSLLCSQDLRKRLTENAYQLACSKYDTSVVVPFFLDLVSQVTGR